MSIMSIKKCVKNSHGDKAGPKIELCMLEETTGENITFSRIYDKKINYEALNELVIELGIKNLCDYETEITLKQLKKTCDIEKINEILKKLFVDETTPDKIFMTLKHLLKYHDVPYKKTKKTDTVHLKLAPIKNDYTTYYNTKYSETDFFTFQVGTQSINDAVKTFNEQYKNFKYYRTNEASCVGKFDTFLSEVTISSNDILMTIEKNKFFVIFKYICTFNSTIYFCDKNGISFHEYKPDKLFSFEPIKIELKEEHLKQLDHVFVRGHQNSFYKYLYHSTINAPQNKKKLDIFLTTKVILNSKRYNKSNLKDGSYELQFKYFDKNIKSLKSELRLKMNGEYVPEKSKNTYVVDVKNNNVKYKCLNVNVKYIEISQKCVLDDDEKDVDVNPSFRTYEKIEKLLSKIGFSGLNDFKHMISNEKLKEKYEDVEKYFDDFKITKGMPINKLKQLLKTHDIPFKIISKTDTNYLQLLDKSKNTNLKYFIDNLKLLDTLKKEQTYKYSDIDTTYLFQPSNSKDPLINLAALDKNIGVFETYLVQMEDVIKIKNNVFIENIFRKRGDILFDVKLNYYKNNMLVHTEDVNEMNVLNEIVNIKNGFPIITFQFSEFYHTSFDIDFEFDSIESSYIAVYVPMEPRRKLAYLTNYNNVITEEPFCLLCGPTTRLKSKSINFTSYFPKKIDIGHLFSILGMYKFETENITFKIVFDDENSERLEKQICVIDAKTNVKTTLNDLENNGVFTLSIHKYCTAHLITSCDLSTATLTFSIIE